MLRKFKQYTAKLFVSLLLFVPLLNGASASSDNLSYDVLSQQFIQAPADFLVPFSKKLYSFCLAKQILEKVESKKTELNSTITITPEVLAGHQSSKGILLGADKEISIKELLRALIFLQAPEANKIALHWLETLSDKKDEPAKASEPEKKINGKSLLEDVGFVIRNLPKEVGQITDQTVEIQEKNFPSNIRISHSEKSDLLFILDNSSKVALGAAIVASRLRENNLRIVLCLVHDSDSNALFPEIAQALVSSVNHFETAKVFTEGKPVTVIPIIDGEQQNIALAPKQDVFITVSSDELKKQKTPKVEMIIERKELIKAPVTTNEPLARINIKLGDRVLKTVPLYAVADVAEKKSKLSDIYKTFKQIMAEQDKKDLPEELPAPLLQFPCEFPMKVVGQRTDDFAQQIVAIIEKHAPDFNASEVEMKVSGKGNYLSLGFLVNATSQDMLDDLYRSLTAHPLVKFVL